MDNSPDREVVRLANYLGIDPRTPSTTLRASSEGGVTTQQYTQPTQPFLFPQPRQMES